MGDSAWLLKASTAGIAGLGTLAWLWTKRKRPSPEVEVEICEEVKITWGATARDRALQVAVKLRQRPARAGDLQIDVYGKGVPRIARMFLPLGQGKFLMPGGGVGTRAMKPRSAAPEPEADLVLDLGWVNPKRETIISQLRQLESADELFILEISCRDRSQWNAESICIVPMRPSLLRKELERQSRGETPKPMPSELAPQEALKAALLHRPSEKSLLGAFLRLALCPSAIVCGAWMLLLRTDFILQLVPHPPDWSMLNRARSLTEVLPPMPTSLLQAFDAGVLCERFQAANETVRAELLAAAAELFGRPVTSAELSGLREELLRELSKTSLAQRVMGFFTFVNTMWLAAIAGITISIGPVLWHLAKPLRQVFAQLFQKVKEALTWLLKNILLPACSRLHEWGFWELLAHTAAFLFTAQSSRMQPGPAEHVAFSGLLACCAAAMYSVKVHGQNLSTVLKKEYDIDLAQLSCLFVALLFSPCAILHGSKLLGFVAVGSLLSALGFRVSMYPFCYVIGWDSEDGMVRTSAACGFGLVSFTVVRLAGLNSRFVEPFSPAISVLGGIGHYLALLIRSNRWYDKRERYMKYNLGMLASLCASQYVGRTYGIPALANTSTTFFVLWGLEKAGELHHVLELSGWFLVFGLSVFSYYAALWLHAHPEFIVTLLK